MIEFTSARERHLWIWTLVVVSAIYSTLGLARTLSAFLGESGLGEGLFIIACFLVLAAVVIQGLKLPPGVPEIGIYLGIVAAYLLIFVRMSIPTERSHLIEYGVVALFIYEALKERARQGRRVPFVAVLAVLATGLIGVIDECIQLLLPSRVFDYRDILFNGLAAVMAVITSASLGWVRRLNK